MVHGFILRRGCSACLSRFSMGCCVGWLVEWISMGWSMGDFDGLEECSSYLGGIFLDRCVRE
jgi:hypothetical protein